MGLVPIFKAIVNPEGRLILRETERSKRQQWLRHLAGSNVEVIVRREPRQRTLDQNAFLHAAVFGPIADYTGETIEKVKRDLMGECFGLVRDDATGELVPRIGHTSSMDVEQATYFIEWVGPFALDAFGLEIPLPGEVEVS